MVYRSDSQKAAREGSKKLTVIMSSIVNVETNIGLFYNREKGQVFIIESKSSSLGLNKLSALSECALKWRQNKKSISLFVYPKASNEKHCVNI
uniref:Uncharacterized protein n=1 Tax=Timema monikensis TaxID=170555 RepID=A0A7R9DX03_9NEOP|nr:unnamed protein product [Timema monikensis]